VQFCTDSSSFQATSQDGEGGCMLLKAALVVLVLWLAGVVGLYEIGSLVHGLLLAGLMLLLLGALKARDAALARHTGRNSDSR
jgi:hypothetical protein